MQRREFITVLGGATLVWPMAARAQQQTRPLIGFLSSRSIEDTNKFVEAFWDGLRGGGFIEGKNIEITYRWANGQYQRLTELAVDLISRRPAVLVTTGLSCSRRFLLLRRFPNAFADPILLIIFVEKASRRPVIGRPRSIDTARAAVTRDVSKLI
jgi:hypothetical protein